MDPTPETNGRKSLSEWLKSGDEGIDSKLSELSDYDVEMLFVNLHELAYKLLTVKKMSEEEFTKLAKEYDFDDPIKLLYKIDRLCEFIEDRIPDSRRSELTTITNPRMKKQYGNRQSN